ncbi:response regulator [Streptomyces vinaceus]|uniref:response regulator n=1 Tax=Streptomyces vinaceus TaxID=1960 RepID=UPI003806299B
MIRVMIVDDDALVRLGLSDLLAADPDIEVVAQAPDGHTAVERASTGSVDVALVDVGMPRTDGITTTRRLRALPESPRIITLATHDVADQVLQAISAGADAFLLKETAPAEILRTVHLVAAGSAVLHPSAARRLIDCFRLALSPRASAAQAMISRLTPREQDVLALLSQGVTNADIAQMLGMRESTVKGHVSRILAACGASNRVQAALLAGSVYPYRRATTPQTPSPWPEGMSKRP